MSGQCADRKLRRNIRMVRNSQQGFGLIETVVSIAIFAMLSLMVAQLFSVWY